MKRIDLLSAFGAAVMAMGPAACSSDDGGRADGDGGDGKGVTGDGETMTGTTDDGLDDDSGGAMPRFDTTIDSGGGPGCDADLGCTDKIDLLFVIDNSGTMGQEQLNLARNFPLLIERLEALEDSAGNPVNPDVNIMVTTTDFGNPECDPYKQHEPEKGAPIASPCSERIERFTGVGEDPESYPEACSQVCPDPVAPEDPFINFVGPEQDENNIPDTAPADVNGDGQEDSEVAQALACIGPQGINGCGYEAPLENMLQALNPEAEWNSGDKPFLRDNALLAIAIITDEADCSVKDWSVMQDPMFQETHPDKDQQPTSAVCWNAGVTCDGPDSDGVYSNCTSTQNDKLHPTSRYTSHLIERLREQQNKEVIMLGILGVPPVTEHNPDPPFEPTAGGVMELVYRKWRSGEWPDGDILPDEAAEGVTAADKEFDFGIGPGCTGFVLDSEEFTGQAIPPVRVKEVCQSLNYTDKWGEDQVRCCMESICSDDFSPAIDCLTGIISETIQPPG